jgi:prefoldin subunit 5
MTPAERLLKQNIDRLHRATKDLTKAFQEQTQMTASVLESITKVMSEMTSTTSRK